MYSYLQESGACLLSIAVFYCLRHIFCCFSELQFNILLEFRILKLSSLLHRIGESWVRYEIQVWRHDTYTCTRKVVNKAITTEWHTEWQRPLSGVHSIMMEKSAQAGEGGVGARPPPLTISTITYKVVMYAPAQKADTLHLFLLYPYMYSLLCGHSYIQVYTKCQR